MCVKTGLIPQAPIDDSFFGLCLEKMRYIRSWRRCHFFEVLVNGTPWQAGRHFILSPFS